ncbi:MAG TPA: DUF3829 domain-containing protein [Ignavibacteria bacterium]|jgi:hypothetical protein
MKKLISVLAVIVAVFLIISCSSFNKLKEKFSSKKDKEKTEETVKEETKEVTSTDDIAFYNKYIEVSNKIQEAGEKVYKDYINDVPDPKSISKNSFILAVGFSFSVDNLQRVTKEYNRSYYDEGELSKLKAAGEMKSAVETELKNLLKVLEDYHATARKVADYYSKGEFKKDLSKAVPYDEEMKSVYDKYKTAFNKFSDVIKNYKPKKERRDPNSISNPDEKAVAILLNAYENTLDKAEEFYDAFNGLEYKEDLSRAKTRLDEFRDNLKEDKNSVMNAGFTEKTKYMKYSYEDYFLKMADGFIEAGKKFFDEAPAAKNQNEFNTLYDAVVNNYNYMISAYNTNINVANTFRNW